MSIQRMLMWIVGACACLALLADQGYGQWNQFRGPNGSGVVQSGELPAQIDADRNVQWRVEIPPGHSSPAILGDRIFVTAKADDLVTICFDRHSGDELWRQACPAGTEQAIDSRNHPASPSPAVDETGVYVFFPDAGLVAYNLEGARKWHVPLGPFDNLYGMGASPILVEDLLILAIDQSTGSYLLAVNKSDGQQRWKTDRPEAKSGHCTPIVIPSVGDDDETDEAGPLLLLPGSFFLTAYDVRSGHKRWWVGGLSFEMKSTPVVFEDIVIVNGFGSPANQPGRLVKIPPFEQLIESLDQNEDRLLQQDELSDPLQRSFFPAVDLNADANLDADEWTYFQAAMRSENSVMALRLGKDQRGDLTDTNVLWRYHRNIPQLPSPIVYGEWLYMIDDGGIATCFHPREGEVKSRGRLAGAEGEYYASPVAADGKIYFVSLAGKTATLANDGTLEPLATGRLNERCYATPAVDGDQIFVRTEQALYAFRKR